MEALIVVVAMVGLVVDLQTVPVVVGAHPIHRLQTSLTLAVRTLLKVTQ